MESSKKLDLSKFIMSQSKLKDFENEDGCPMFWWFKYVDGTAKISSDAMEQGLYFESECIDAHAHDDELISVPVSVEKNQKPTALGKRMASQVDKFKDWFDEESETYQGHIITDVQLKLSGIIGGLQWEGTADFMTEKEPKSQYMWDLKHTADVTNTFGDYGWGNYQNLDYLQQVVYNELYEQQEKRSLDGIYMLVMDSSTKQGHKRIKVDITWDTPATLKEVEDRLDDFKETVDYYNENGWPKITCKRECETCPFKKCPKKWKENLGFNDVDSIYL